MQDFSIQNFLNWKFLFWSPILNSKNTKSLDAQEQISKF